MCIRDRVKKGDVDLNTDDYSGLNGEVYLLTTEGNVQNAQKYSNVKVADPKMCIRDRCRN